jgi:hypothetical protein
VSSLVDAAVLAALRAVPNLNVHDAYVTDSDGDAMTISAPLPYVVYYPAPGRPEARSMAGPAGAETKEFQVTFVGATRQQAMWACEKVRAALDDVRLSTVTGNPVLRRTDDQLFIRRDDTWSRPGGGPLMYGADRWSVTHL